MIKKLFLIIIVLFITFSISGCNLNNINKEEISKILYDNNYLIIEETSNENLQVHKKELNLWIKSAGFDFEVDLKDMIYYEKIDFLTESNYVFIMQLSNIKEAKQVMRFLDKEKEIEYFEFVRSKEYIVITNNKEIFDLLKLS